jgi:hypothetical protein
LLTDEKLEDIQMQLQISPWKTGVSVGSASKAAKLIKLYLCRVTVINELKPVDASQRIQFCNWLLKNVHDRLIDHQLLFLTDEAYFHLSGYVNCKNT